MAASLAEQNPPIDVEFSGWTSNTHRLGRCGWDMAVGTEYGPYRNERRVLFHHRGSKFTLVGSMPGGAMLYPHQRYCGVIRIHQVISENTTIVSTGNPFDCMAWVDTQPQIIDLTGSHPYSHPLFRELEKPAAQELIINPEDVSRILELVHKAQAPEQREIRRRNETRERRMQLHAHILSEAA